MSKHCSVLHYNAKFSRIAANILLKEMKESDALLHLLKVVAKNSRSGSTGVYETLNSQGRFSNSLQFHLQWAESHGQKKDLEGFKKVLDLARDRLVGKQSLENLESGFRDLADEYFPGDVDKLFSQMDDTNIIFKPLTPNGNQRKGRRRSSVAILQRAAASSNPTAVVSSFGPKTRTLIRPEFICRSDGYFGISVEEFRAAQLSDDQGGDMDITEMEEAHNPQNGQTRRDSGIVKNIFEPLKTNSDAVIQRMKEIEKENRRRKMSQIEEEQKSEKTLDDSLLDSTDDKRPRFHSPLAPAKTKSNVSSLRDKTIVLSSDSARSGTAADRTLGVDSSFTLENVHSAQKGGLSTKEGRTSSQKPEISFTETAYNEARALFSDTVHLKDGSGGEEDLTTAVKGKSPPVEESFDVLDDPDPTMLVHSEKRQSDVPSSGLNVVFDLESSEESPLLKSDEIEQIASPIEPHPHGADESIIMGNFFRRSGISAVTSTPMESGIFVSAEEFFGNSHANDVLKSKHEDDDGVFAMPKMPPAGFRRQSLANTTRTNTALSVKNESQNKGKSSSALEKDISVSDVLESDIRRLSIGGVENISQKTAEVDLNETTGESKRRRSEVITGMNPWDPSIRKKIMASVRPPTHLHEFEGICPKVQAMRDLTVSGENVQILTLIGQGGYAKVYKGKLEDDTCIAVKYEVPSCAWEVYACDQIRHRLLKNANADLVNISNNAVMQITEAYIYKNASLIFNAFHEYGTLLDLTNSVHDPHWMHVLFVAIQMARIVRSVHGTMIVHGDIKPDNFMITKKIDAELSSADVLDDYVIKLIDWGRSIDLASFRDSTFKGRAGTECFDCPEMIDGRPWTYQPDYFGYIASVVLIATGKYESLKVDGFSLGEYRLPAVIKRRLVIRDMLTEMIHQFLNIPSCNELPSWDAVIEKMESFWHANFTAVEWRSVVGRFNGAISSFATR
ncbi:unnamed protein product [Caenorhabditis auriculariae]|uniref:Protein kinase domain-containing protein n=1 Tax=Caenorhabditis auriculariae TaxID=2777116 RepID=A0A8S1GTI9_9PELO|nr:unnamed protein product [Caenorhabditis auriculariae]